MQKRSFLRADQELYAEFRAGQVEDSGTTALAALVLGSSLVVANAGDSRAVLCRRGRAIELTQDHKPNSPFEAQRIRDAGGTVCIEGLLNGELSVSRAIGDYFSTDLKYIDSTGTLFLGPLTAEPDVATHVITPEDEFVLLACDGLWDVFSSQRAVEFARGKLREHNDVARCLGELVGCRTLQCVLSRAQFSLLVKTRQVGSGVSSFVHAQNIVSLKALKVRILPPHVLSDTA